MKRAARSKEPAIRRVISILLVFMLLIGTTGLANSVRAAGDEEGPAEEVVIQDPAEGTEDSDGEEESAQQPEENPEPAQGENENPSEPTQENASQEGEQGESAGTSEGEAPKQEETVWTAKHFEGGANGIHVIVDAPEGALPEGTTMVVTPVTDPAVLAAIASAAEENAEQVVAVDITFLTADAEPIEPAKEIFVTMKSAAIEAADDTVVVHMDDAGETTVVDQAPNSADDEVSFASKEFSVYGLVKKVITQPVLTADGQNYLVTVNYDESAGIPDGTKLDVQEILQGSAAYDTYLKKAADALKTDVDAISYARFFDITLWNDGKEIQPALGSTVDVKIELADKAENTQVIHFGEEPEKVAANSVGKTVNFAASGFSVYAVVGEGDTGDYARMNLHFMNGTDEVAVMIVKNGDTRDELETIIYDPGAGTIPAGQIFKGWSTEASYSVADAENGMNIDAVRDWAAAHTITENEDVYIYAMLYKRLCHNKWLIFDEK